MQPNIAMKFAEYMVWILLFYNSRDIEFFSMGLLFMAHAVHEKNQHAEQLN